MKSTRARRPLPYDPRLLARDEVVSAMTAAADLWRNNAHPPSRAATAEEAMASEKARLWRAAARWIERRGDLGAAAAGEVAP